MGTNKYGKRLRELREQHGYTQESLAQVLNTSRSRIGMYEQGKRQPDFEMQEAIADLFNVSLDYLFGRGNNEANQQTTTASNYFDNLNDESIEFAHLFQDAPEEDRSIVMGFLRKRQPKP